MKSDFSRVLSNLRKEKGLSQREASENLEISQALLSHYEKGMREPGLAFVARAADYYSVSCDYLLGRSLDKQGNALSADKIHDASTDKDNVLTGSVIAMLQKKLILNSISVIIDMVGKTKNKELINEVTTYFYFPIYKVYRYLLNENNIDQFNTNDKYFDCLCDAEQKIKEVKIKALANNDLTYSISDKKIENDSFTSEKILTSYNKHATSLFSVVQSVSDIIGVTTNPHTKTKPKKAKK